MKRDVGLYREILLTVESWPPNHRRQRIVLEGRDQELVDRHIQLLDEDGLVIASILELPELGHVKKAEVQRMTAAGHDFLDAIRDEGIWKRVQERVTAVGGSTSLDVIKQLAIAYVQAKLDLS